MNVNVESYGQAVILNCKGEMTADSLGVFKQAVEHQLEERGRNASGHDPASAETAHSQPHDTPDGSMRGSAGAQTRNAASSTPEAGPSQVRDVVLNLEHVPFIDSAALEYLLELQQRLLERQGQVKLAAMDENVVKILEITRLESSFERYTDLAQAVKTL